LSPCSLHFRSIHIVHHCNGLLIQLCWQQLYVIRACSLISGGFLPQLWCSLVIGSNFRGCLISI
jgi:hypothetical protein